MSNLYGGLTTPHWNQIDKIHYGPASTLEPKTDGIMLGRYVLVKYTKDVVFSQEDKNKIITGVFGTEKDKTSEGEIITRNNIEKGAASEWYSYYVGGEKNDGGIDYDGVVFIKQLSSNTLVYIPVARVSTTVTDASFTNINSNIDAIKTSIININTKNEEQDSTFNILIDKDTGKSIRTIANEELVEQLLSKDAEASFKTLQELATWIEDHPESAAEMNEKISSNTDAISDEVDNRIEADNALQNSINGILGQLTLETF